MKFVLTTAKGKKCAAKIQPGHKVDVSSQHYCVSGESITREKMVARHFTTIPQYLANLTQPKGAWKTIFYFVACEQVPKWGIGRKEKSASRASGARFSSSPYTPLESLFTGYLFCEVRP